METMSPQQGTMGQNRSDSLTGESKSLPENKKVPSGHVSAPRTVSFKCAADGAFNAVVADKTNTLHFVTVS